VSARVFGVDYQFLACGDVFTQGLAHAAADLGLVYRHADCRAWDLADQIERFRPDLVVVVHGRVAHNRLGKAGETTPTALWLLDEPYEVDETSRWSRRFTYVGVNDVATLHRHERASYLPVCYDPQVHRPGDGVRAYAVGFIGGGNPSRERILGALVRRQRLDYVVGGPWNDPLVRARCLSPNVPPSRTVRLYQQTRIVVNVFRDKHHYNRDHIEGYALNPRVYEALACGALVVSEWRPEVASLVPELPTFHGVDDAVAIVDDLLAHPERAEAIRAACAARLASHTYAQRLSTLLARANLAPRVEAVA
jgi:spore maturation protein CgeB